MGERWKFRYLFSFLAIGKEQQFSFTEYFVFFGKSQNFTEFFVNHAVIQDILQEGADDWSDINWGIDGSFDAEEMFYQIDLEG